MLRVVAGVLSWLLSMCVCLLAPAQVISGSIDAAVVDPAGAAVPDATVTAVNNSTGRPYTCVTRSDGRCRVEGVSAGSYAVDVRRSGFAPWKTRDVPVPESREVPLPVTLALGQDIETVEVESAAPQLNTTSVL